MEVRSLYVRMLLTDPDNSSLTAVAAETLQLLFLHLRGFPSFSSICPFFFLSFFDSSFSSLFMLFLLSFSTLTLSTSFFLSLSSFPSFFISFLYLY